MRKFNWSIFVVCICVGNFGALSNPSFNSIGVALLWGTLFGVVYGSLMGYITRED
jgi:hypothetical protein